MTIYGAYRSSIHGGGGSLAVLVIIQWVEVCSPWCMADALFEQCSLLNILVQTKEFKTPCSNQEKGMEGSCSNQGA